MRRAAAIGTSFVVLAVPGLAAAQAPVEPGVPEADSTARGGKVSLDIVNGQRTKKRVYFTRGQAVLLKGRSRPFVAGQKVIVEFVRNGAVVARKAAKVRRGGRWASRFKVKRSGRLKLRARRGSRRGVKSRFAKLSAGAYRAGAGVKGVRVLLLQRSLKRMGYAVPVTGYYDDGTAHAVNAFRKVNHLGRDGYATPHVYRRVFRDRGAFKPRFPRAGRHVEFDWSRQVLALIDKGRARHVYHASSGTAATPTVFGKFSFYRKQPGTNSLGMVDSNYFIGGYAIHGYHSVPNYPASHGCIRVPIPNAGQIDRQIELGQKIFVYR